MTETKEQVQDNLILGLLNWYPWQQGKTIHFQGCFPEVLRQDILSRGVVETGDGKYDYIVAWHLIEEEKNPIEVLTRCRNDLKEGGHLFLACDNRMALRFFAGDSDPYTNRVFDGIEDYRNLTEKDREIIDGRCYARCDIEEYLDKAGFYDRRGYSVLPGLEMPQQIYAWDYLPEEDLAIRYTPVYRNPKTVFMDLPKLYEGIVKNGMFHQTANAYLIDCSKDGQFYEFDHVTTSMDRGKENATATILQKDGIVVKRALYPEGNARIQELLRNTEDLNSKGIRMVACKQACLGQCANHRMIGVQMERVSAPTVLQYLRELIFQDKDLFIRKTCEFLNLILQSSQENEGESSELAPIYQDVYIDMVPLNSFYRDGEYVFFDQEFKEQNYPIKVVLVRTLDILYMGDKKMEELVPMEYFLSRYDIESKISVYRTMGDTYIKKLRNMDFLADYNRNHLAQSSEINVNKQRINYTETEYRNIFVDLLKDIENKKIYVFGSGVWARKFIAEYGDKIRIEALIDNNPNLWGRTIDDVDVKSPEVLYTENLECCKVIVCIKNYGPVLMQLNRLGVKYYGVYDPHIERDDMGVATSETIRGGNLIGGKEEEPTSNKKYHIGYVAGVFDLFHIGHLNLLRRAKEQCDILIVGVVSDEQAGVGKARSLYVNEEERRTIVEACKYVDEAFILPAVSSGTRDVYRKYRFDVQFSGSDYQNDPNWLADRAWLREHGADLIFFPYTESTSSTKLKDVIENVTQKKDESE
ncbi:MAG: adenylyltransferase/cytidyltransferase family protein [Lachnospiraceae bacterium]|nr:adenylyltransferase/cytidyltransferase family protein [Lachnospiraceae bacterium]